MHRNRLYAASHRMGRTLGLGVLVLCAVVSRVESWPGDGDMNTNFDSEETNWRTEAGHPEGGETTSEEERREKRQDGSEGDATRLKHLAIEKALTARKIPPTHRGNIYTIFYYVS